MKLRTLKIGQVIITPKMSLSLIGAFLILGVGIGATVASSNNSKLALLICSIISIIIVAKTFSEKQKN
jgi:hypothetical protein